MNAWSLIDAELVARKRQWKWLAESLELTIQTVNHWKARGVPAKYYAAIEDLLGKPRGFLVDGHIDDAEAPPTYSTEALALAWLLDQIPSRLDKTIANNAATAAILEVLQKTALAPTHTQAQRVNPAKQTS